MFKPREFSLSPQFIVKENLSDQKCKSLKYAHLVCNDKFDCDTVDKLLVEHKKDLKNN